MTVASKTVPAALAWLPALREPHIALGWSLAEWEHVVRLARRLRLLARLTESLQAAGLLEQVPQQPLQRLLAEQRLSHWRSGAMVWALERIAIVLDQTDYPLVLLKGSAYIGQGLPIAAGRMPSDVDILVPHAFVGDAQTRLKLAGWEEPAMSAHDLRYYNEYSHEVPPLTHNVHGIELDLHHNILPPVARTHVDAALLLSRLQPSHWPAWKVLAPVDQVLHSAAHLFLDSEPRDRVRDLVDMDGLMRHFGRDPAFFAELPARAHMLGLAEPLALACHFTTRWLGTPIPASTQAEIARLGPGAMRRAWLLPLMTSILTPAMPDDTPPLSQEFAALVVLARYHRQRLPLRVLVPHIWVKLRTRSARATGKDGEDAPPPV